MAVPAQCLRVPSPVGSCVQPTPVLCHLARPVTTV